jgi:hypothetical protein
MINPDKNKRPVKNGASIMKKAEEAVRAFRASGLPDGHDEIRSDVLGSYKGEFYDGGEPDQDADDL